MILTCQSAVDLLLDYVEGSLPRQQQDAMREHLSGCHSCEAFVNSYNKTQDLCRNSDVCPVPDELGQRLLTFLRAQRHDKNAR